MKCKSIHQFHSGTAPGDAVTNAMFFTQGLLRHLGFESNIYAEHIPREIASRVCRFESYRPAADQALLVHHSMGHDRTDWILNNSDLKLLVYHNITPAMYFDKGSCFGRYSEIGRKQLELFRPAMKGAICDSEFNAQELRDLGYELATVIPLLLDVEKVRTAPWRISIPEAQGETFTVLFVGRINENKCQHDLIEVFRHLQVMMDRPTQLVLIGDYQGAGDYYPRLLQQAEESDDIRFLGKVSAEDLYGWYRAADVFLCMSEHEGFGVPLIEAMVFDIPVIAYRSSVIPQTLGGAGLLVSEKRFPEIAGLIKVLAEDRAFRRAVIRKQRQRVQDFHPRKITSQLVKALREMGIDSPAVMANPPLSTPQWPEGHWNRPEPICHQGLRVGKPPGHTAFEVAGTSQESGDWCTRSFQIEGPFETSYSLAVVNREVALALEKLRPGRVSLFATEGPGDYQPDMKQVRKIPGLESLCLRGKKGSAADVVIRNLYPPRVADMDGLVNLLYFAWEESALPEAWVQSFNHHLDGLTVLSRFVKKVLIDAGVHVPILVAGCGIPRENSESESRSPNPIQRLGHFALRLFAKSRNLGKGFRFLHVSSGFPRKGIDVLLEVYTREFTSRDPVTLVIKTFPNPHNQVEQLVRRCRERNVGCPEIVLINKDLPGEALQDLYRQCHALVAPSRGEGFGLPMIEAMAAGIPVITTATGGQMDFCTQETSWLIDYQWEPARTHMGLSDSVWAEPDAGHLGQIMREMFEVFDEKANGSPNQDEFQNAKYQQCLKKIETAKRLVQSHFTWDQCARRVMHMLQRIQHQKPLSWRKIKLGWLTPCNSLSDIFASTNSWIENLDRENYELRIWADLLSPSEVQKTIAGERFDAVVIQFHSSLFHLPSLENLLDSLHARGIVTIVFLNDLDDPAAASLTAISSQLARCHRLLVSGIDDLNQLKKLQLIDNVTLFPHLADPKRPSSSNALGRRLDGMIRALVQDAQWQKAVSEPGHDLNPTLRFAS